MELEPPILIETLGDNLAAKMNALVFRGAPRDFRDVHDVVQAGLATVSDCWCLWQAENPSAAMTSAGVELVRHLEAIERRRPLEAIPEAEREAAAALPAWVRDELVTPGRKRQDWRRSP